MHLTTKQIELMRVIVAGNGPGDPCDLDQILDRIHYETTKQSLQFSIRALIARGLIEKLGPQKRRGRMRQVICATEQGRALMGAAATKPAFIEPEDDFEDPLGETTEP